MSTRDGDSGAPKRRERRKLTRREILDLILRTYAVSLPYVLVFIAVMLVATWFFTEFVFR